jgi:preprotein translocase subunit SecE
VAQSKGRDDDERIDDSPEEELAAEDGLDQEFLDEDDEEPVGRRSGAPTVTRSRSLRAGGKASTGRTRSRTGDVSRSGNRLVNFFREVVAELRKVIYPTRSELITYTTVVIVFVTIMVSIVAGFDFAFAKAVLHVFGNGGKTTGQ